MIRFIFALSILISTQSFAVSFDCSKFNTGVYKIICDSPTLSKLDDKLAERYNQAIKFYDNDPKFKELIRETLKVRGLCKDEACLIDWYERNLEEYEKLDDEVLAASNHRSSRSVPDWTILNGMPATLDNVSNTGAFIGYSKNGGYDFFILPFWANRDVCKRGQSGLEVVESLHFNGVLIQMGQGCDGEIPYFMPLTYNGTTYIINQFKTKNIVYVTDSKGRHLFRFGAIGFTKALQQFVDSSGRTGGL